MVARSFLLTASDLLNLTRAYNNSESVFDTVDALLVSNDRILCPNGFPKLGFVSRWHRCSAWLH
jgi:hypothetical protein